MVPMLMSLDVKTARKPYNLIVEEGKVLADIYVLAGIDDNDRVTFHGWEHRRVLATAPVRDFGYGVMNHYIAREKLRPMRELESRIGSIESFCKAGDI